MSNKRRTEDTEPEFDQLSEDEKRRILDEELEIVSRFFAFEGGDEANGESDEEVWARLTSKVRVRFSFSNAPLIGPL